MDNSSAEVTARGLNEEFRKSVIYVAVWVGVELIVGLIGNTAVLFVFFFRYQACNFRYFVLCLSFLDFISTFTTMAGEMVTELYWYIYPVPVFCKIKSFCNVFTVTGEAFCLCAIAVDRYRKVCRPFAWQIRPRHALILCVVIYVLAAILSTPVPIFWGVHSYNRTEGNGYVLVTVCEKDQKYLNTGVHLKYIDALLVIMPFVLVPTIIMYGFVGCKLFKRSISRGCSEPTVSKSSLDEQNSGKCQQILTIPVQPVKDQSTNVTSTVDFELDEVGRNHEHCVNGDTEVRITVNNACESNDFNNESNEKCKKSNINGSNRQTYRRKSESSPRNGNNARIRRKTVIMLILTGIFSVSVIEYLACLATVAYKNDVLPYMSNLKKSLFFLGLRIVFINHAINPIVYWFLDNQFRKGLRSIKTDISNAFNCGR